MTDTIKRILYTPTTMGFIVMTTVTIHDAAGVLGVGEKRDARENLTVVMNTLDVWEATTILRGAVFSMKLLKENIAIVDK
mmetsp:Transcript_12715/g.30057  ORF Transcript_12715/g.30057 Transcript_12715/m.30057 type:complete len:80 (+) Transcript_12715:1976-2215(+)